MRPSRFLPASLIHAIGQHRVLPLVGDRSFEERPTQAISDDLRGGRQDKAQDIERLLPIYDAALAVADNCVLALTSDTHLHGVLNSVDGAWVRVRSASQITENNRRVLIELYDTVDPRVWELARGHAARSPLLLLGLDPDDESLADLVFDLRPNRYFQPAGWLLAYKTSDSTAARWSSLGVEVVAGPTEELIRELRHFGTSLPRVRQIVRRTPVDVDNPYKALDSFTRQDAALFFGRRQETGRLVELVCANRLVVVTGASGNGKTSLLQAGLLAWSDQNPPFVGVSIRCGDNPEGSVAIGLREALGPGSFADGTLALLQEFGRRRCGLPIIVLDQAEELFTRFSDELRSRFVALLRQVLAKPDLHTRIVLGIREDFLSRLTELRSAVPSILQNTFYVPALTEQAAIEAIREPALSIGVDFELTLAKTIIDDINGHRIAPPQLQIVCDRLFRERGHDEISTRLYASLGGARRILGQFMNEQISKLESRQVEARDVLKAMVTSEGTKDVLSGSEIAHRARRDVASVEAILWELRDKCRLVRLIDGDRPVRFELVHEYLTTDIWNWMSADEKDRREIEELLIKDLRSWRQFKTIRLGADRLAKFTHCSGLIECDADALTLLLLSSVAHRQNPQVWLMRLDRLGRIAQDGVAYELFSYFSGDDVNQRCEAAEVIASLDSSVLVRALASPAVAHRRSALEMLGGLRVASALKQVQACTKDSDTLCRELACGALGAIGGTESVRTLTQIAAGTDVAMACFAIQALGRIGLTEESLETVLTALRAKEASVVKATQNALAIGNSPAILERLLKTDVGSKPLGLLWHAVRRLPYESRPWFQGVLRKLSAAELSGGETIPITEWVGEDLQLEKFSRGLPSQFEKWTPGNELARIQSGNVSGAAAALKRLDGPDYLQVVEVLASFGQKMDDLVLQLASDDAVSLRVAAVDILLKRSELNPSSCISRTLDSAAGDNDPQVRALACHLAMRMKAWGVLDRLMRLDQHGAVRASSLRGLMAAEAPQLPAHYLERALAGPDAIERYWACIYARQKGVTSLTSVLRSLALDDTPIANSGYQKRLTWPGHLPEIGHSVSEAADAALATLAPASQVWREHRAWQIHFKK